MVKANLPINKLDKDYVSEKICAKLTKAFGCNRGHTNKRKTIFVISPY